MLSDEERKVIEELKNKKADYFMISNLTCKILLNLIEEAEQKEKKAYIDGTNVAHELCNKYWNDKIKAKIEESELLIDNSQGCMSDEDLYKEYGKIEFGQSLLEKE